jgi:hypothetical protein
MTYVWAVKYVLALAPTVRSPLIDIERRIHIVGLDRNRGTQYITNDTFINLISQDLEGGEEVGDGDDNLKK